MMSSNSELKARLARLGPVRDVSRPSLSSDDSVVVVLHRTGELDKGILVARRLVASGLTLYAPSRMALAGPTMSGIGKPPMKPNFPALDILPPARPARNAPS